MPVLGVGIYRSALAILCIGGVAVGLIAGAHAACGAVHATVPMADDELGAALGPTHVMAERPAPKWRKRGSSPTGLSLAIVHLNDRSHTTNAYTEGTRTYRWNVQSLPKNNEDRG